jgi:hypothetical protein
MISPLNPIRFIFIATIPLFIFFLLILNRRRKKLLLVDLSSLSQRFEIFYVVLAFCLIVFYACGLATTSGEALVRLFTLLSFPALLAFTCSGGLINAPIATYILLINSCFFLATLNMWPSSILYFMRWLGKS